ncbi:hypothetical protein RJ639_020782 [Escallonia herrerae]|uniref:Uncharacterized protein n=1 Tax=Escallonia herrerae TaxID=1293975 RepID=A0AA88V5V4_9ASTE|nr:hypothetical protein RJ639_020782 [Escallonia herrerae]
MGYYCWQPSHFAALEKPKGSYVTVVVQRSLQRICLFEEPLLEPGDNASENEKKEWQRRNDDEVMCRGHILNAFSDRLYNFYKSFDSAKEIWKALEYKYKVQEEGTNKFLISEYNDFTMIDGIPILHQVHELQDIANKICELDGKLPESFQVGMIIAKLPPSWKDYRKKLLHREKKFTLEKIQKHLRIEEESRNRDKKGEAEFNSKVNYVDAASGKSFHALQVKKEDNILENPKGSYVTVVVQRSLQRICLFEETLNDFSNLNFDEFFSSDNSYLSETLSRLSTSIQLLLESQTTRVASITANHIVLLHELAALQQSVQHFSSQLLSNQIDFHNLLNDLTANLSSLPLNHTPILDSLTRMQHDLQRQQEAAIQAHHHQAYLTTSILTKQNRYLAHQIFDQAHGFRVTRPDVFRSRHSGTDGEEWFFNPHLPNNPPPRRSLRVVEVVEVPTTDPPPADPPFSVQGARRSALPPVDPSSSAHGARRR